MKSLKQSFFFLLISGIILTACDTGDYLLNQTEEIDAKGWNYTDTVTFKANIQDTTLLYNLSLILEHTTAYAKQNLYIKIHTTFPNGQRFSKQVSIDLADKAGKWYGDCSSEKCLLDLPIQQNAFFNQIGEHQFVIEQFTRYETLPDIQKVGFKVENMGQKR